MIEFKQFQLDELCDITSSKRIFSKEYVSDGVPFYRGKEITELYNGSLDVTTQLFITEEKYRVIKKAHGVPESGDMLLTSVGTLGSTYIVKEIDKFYFKDGNLTWFRNFNGLDGRYLKLWLETAEGKHELQRSVIGAAQPAYTISNLKKVNIKAPALSIQYKIIDYLSAFESLIENNTRRIAILEEMAQCIFREWFLESNIENATSMSVTEAININPKIKLPKEGEKPFIEMASLSETSMIIQPIASKTGNSGAKFQNGDTLFARITPCLQNGKIGFVQGLPEDNPNGFGSTEFIVLRETEYCSSEFIYLFSRTQDFRQHAINSMAGADGRQRVNKDCFNSYYIDVPLRGVMDKFTNTVQPIFKSIQNLSRQNQNLKNQRDLLLPKLISGQIELS